MRNSTIFTTFFLMFFVFTAIGQKSYINPAAKYCEMLGYRYEISSQNNGGDAGLVHLPDGRIVNAWDFYKGKVAPEYSYAAKLGFEIETEVVKENGAIYERPVCVRSNKGVEERIPLLELMELNGEGLIAEVPRTSPTVQEIAKVDPNFTTAKSLPTDFDWRSYNGHTYIGDARDQGGCGSCYAFGATACAEGTYNFATGSYDNNTADFSEGWIAFCLSEMSAYSSHFDGCNGADYEYAELQALVDVGHIDESYFPYSDANNQSCPSTTDGAPKIQFEGWYRVASSDVDAIKTAIMTYGVVDAAVYVTNDWYDYTGGVYSANTGSCNNGAYTTTNHAIALVGWGYDATYGDYWILRNSWGTSWGENGYMKIAHNSAAVDCAVCYMVYENIPQPPVANFSADNTTVLAGSSVNFADASSYDPTSWSWSFEGGTPSTSTSQNPTVTYNTLGTYNVTLTVTNAQGSDAETKTNYINVVDELPLEYCTSQGNDYSYEWISDVTIGDFTNTSGATGYSDFTDQTVVMEAGMPYDVSLTPAFSGSTYNEYWKIWVDLNRDGDFDDAGELIFDAGALSKSTVTGTATIPAGTAPKTTTMRVSMKYNAEQTACETFTYGEVEDYSVLITGGDSEAPTAPNGLTAYNITMTGLSLAWNASTDNIGVTGYDVFQNGSVIGSTTSTSYNISGLNSGTSYSYYVVAQDASGNESDPSSTINVTTLTDTEAPSVPSGLVSSGITQTSFVLSWNASSDNVAVDGYEVYMDGSYLATTSSTSYTVSGLTQATTYAMTVYAFDEAGNTSAASNALNVTTSDEVIVIDYCDLYSTSTRFEWIDVFGLNDLYNESTASSGYADYTGMIANVSLGTSYTATLSAGFKRRTYTEYWNVWIDFNIDGEFTSDEIVIQGTVSDGNIYTATVDIPSTATIGQTRMRVSMSDAGYSDPCGTIKYGEVEDYTVNIMAKAAPETYAAGGMQLGNEPLSKLKVYPNPVQDELNLDIPFDEAVVKIINATGAVVKEVKLNGEKVINTSDLNSGLYIISIEDEKGPITETFIKK